MRNWFANLTMMALASIFLAACGDDSGTVSGGSTKLSNADMEVDSYSQLPSCVEKREEKTAYVADQEQGYICQGGGWYESDAVETISAESRFLFESSSSTSLPLFTQNGSGTMIDYRDGKTYKTVKIGSQTWMAENLKYDNGSSCNTKQDRHACDIEKKGMLLFQDYSFGCMSCRLAFADHRRIFDLV